MVGMQNGIQNDTIVLMLNLHAFKKTTNGVSLVQIRLSGYEMDKTILAFRMGEGNFKVETKRYYTGLSTFSKLTTRSIQTRLLK